MYYNLTTEQKYILTLSDTMLKEGYTVDEVIEFLQCEDMDQVECILGTLTLIESVDVDHPDLELVVERIGTLGRIGSWLTRQAGKLKGVFSKGASGASKTKINLKPKTTKVTSTNRTGPAKNIRDKLGGGKKVTGDVIKKGSKLKTGLKVAGGIGAAALLATGIDSVMNNSDSDSDDSNTGNQNQSGNTPPAEDPNDGRTKGYGSRTRAYGWWKRSNVGSPYVDTDHFKNIRRTQKQSEK
jgi:hypothetical protein